MATIQAQTTMAEINSSHHGARRALFAKYHIGGCSSCAYKDNETLESVCKRNEIDLNEAIEYIKQCEQEDQKMLISPQDLKQLIDSGAPYLLIDTRTSEEHEAVAIPNSTHLTQQFQQEVFASHDPEIPIILYDHSGKSVLDTAAWFIGHSLPNTKALDGGIDAYSQQIDKSIPRYRIEID